eukprot:TRINITY_DN4050_c0_g1_i1.p1 TRINITY_DN4050_c0_g1~~TRINITY_DN4050_c0_g1_i1.p1  ORF type:complete len:223 (+),score=70.67 TRINITY_DN4050_c0_g1_i1:773-1441(+)
MFLRKSSAPPPGVRVVARYPLPQGGSFVVSHGSIVDFGVGSDWPRDQVAIVNAANTGGVFGGGVDRAVVQAGGEELAKARHALPVHEGSRQKRIDFGSAVTTGPGDYGKLHGRYVVHAVGPDYVVLKGRGASTAKTDGLLRSAYATALQQAEECGIAYLGFSLLSAGVFRGPCSVDHVLAIAVDAVRSHSYRGLKEVHLMAYTPQELAVLQKLAKAAFAGGA